jgi:hypothetical protein
VPEYTIHLRQAIDESRTGLDNVQGSGNVAQKLMAIGGWLEVVINRAGKERNREEYGSCIGAGG